MKTTHIIERDLIIGAGKMKTQSMKTHMQVLKSRLAALFRAVLSARGIQNNDWINWNDCSTTN